MQESGKCALSRCDLERYANHTWLPGARRKLTRNLYSLALSDQRVSIGKLVAEAAFARLVANVYLIRAMTMSEAFRRKSYDRNRDLPLVAGIELGGTKCIAVLSRGNQVVARSNWPTAMPSQTLKAIRTWLSAQSDSGSKPDALGLCSFGPLGLEPTRSDYGFITNTPKSGWTGYDLRGAFAAAFDGPIGFDTDVAAAALAEGRWGAARGARVHVYLTIGTGIGGGVVVDGEPVHGLIHPEIGHIRTRSAADGFAGICVYHGDCVEGLASGPAIAARAGAPADTLAEHHPVWAHVAEEIGDLAAILVLTMSAERIVIGGGVATGKPFLLQMIQKAARARLAGYLPAYETRDFICAPGLGADAGPLGAVALALRALG